MKVDSEEELIDNQDSENEDNVLPDEEDSDSTYEEDADEYENNDNFMTSREETYWRKTAPSSRRRTWRRNSLLKAHGLTEFSRNLDNYSYKWIPSVFWWKNFFFFFFFFFF